MAITHKLELRQGQSLVITPQLQQAIKLLQLSSLDLATYVEAELERNPLLEPGEPDGAQGAAEEADEPCPGEESAAQKADAAGDDWLDLERDVGQETQDPLDADLGNVFDEGDAHRNAAGADGWASVRPASSAGVGLDIEAFLEDEKGLADHLIDQLNLSAADPAQRLIGRHLIDMVDEAGYLRGDLAELCERLGAPMSLIENTLTLAQTFDPIGVFARDLKECLYLQLAEKDRYDPAMAALLENLPLLIMHDSAALRRICGVDQEDLSDMIAEIKALNPKPGLKFGRVTVQPVVPDVLVSARPDGNWLVELNSDSLPRVLVNHAYYATVWRGAVSKQDKAYIAECFQTASWLVKSLDQRARTILKVAQEIVRRQDAFLVHGVQHLRPLVLKTVAEAVEMHESTVSRVTANKYMSTPRGVFELKYFFTSAIASSCAGEAHSSEAVRHRIRKIIDAERPDAILSDDQIVSRLKADGVDIARRTVAKYREALRIPSSVHRRREKRAPRTLAAHPPEGRNGG